MAKITDLPDEIIEMILQHFKVPNPYHHTVQNENLPADARIAQLAALTQVCKRFFSIAVPLLEQSHYAKIDLRSLLSLSEEVEREELAIATTDQELPRLICYLDTSRTYTLFTLLAGTHISGSLRRLSLDFTDDYRYLQDHIDLRFLSHFPNLVTLEVTISGPQARRPVFIGPSVKLSTVKELVIRSTQKASQTVTALSLVEPQQLETLNLDAAALRVPFDSPSLWTRAFGEQPLLRVTTLQVTIETGCFTSHRAIEEITTHFPALTIFNLIFPVWTHWQEVLSVYDVCAKITFLSITPWSEPFFMALLNDIKTGKLLKPRLHRLHIDTRRTETDWDSRLIELSREARQAADAKDVDLTPRNLTEILHGRLHAAQVGAG